MCRYLPNKSKGNFTITAKYLAGIVKVPFINDANNYSLNSNIISFSAPQLALLFLFKS